MNPVEAIALAVEDHKEFCRQKGCGPDYPFIDALKQAQAEVERLSNELQQARVECDHLRDSANRCEDAERKLASLQSWKAVTLQKINSMRDHVCGIGIVGNIDGMDVIRRLSALDIVDRCRLSIEQPESTQPLGGEQSE